VTFGPSGRWGDYLDDGFAIAALQTGSPIEADCATVMFCRSLGDHLTCIQGLSAFRGLDADFGWLLWAALNTWHILDASLQDEIVDIISTNASSAATLYAAHPDLSETHDRIFWASFSATMPIVTAAFNSGSHKRAKA
jgi:hypothetical protein